MQEVEEEWKSTKAISEGNSANQTGQLEAWQFLTKSGNSNLPCSKSEEISENEMPGMRKEIPKEETRNKYGDAAREIEIDAIVKHGAFIRVPFSGIPEGDGSIGGRAICLRYGK